MEKRIIRPIRNLLKQVAKTETQHHFTERSEIMANKINLQQQANEIIRIAEESGVQSNFFFVTTFKRYQVQLNILTELEKTMKEEGMLVSKEYVKGRKNLYANPAVAEYNKTTDSANKTVSTLLRILRNYNVDDNTEEEDPLLAIINGGDSVE